MHKIFSWTIPTIFALVSWSHTAYCHFLVQAYSGVTLTQVSPNDLLFDNETDSLKPDRDQKTLTDFTWGFGAAYRWTLNHVNLLHDISVGFDVFYLQSKQHGDVWQYQMLSFNNLKYTIPITSTRLMIDTEWALRPFYKYYFLFFEGGIGFAHNKIAYNDTVYGSGTAPVEQLNSNAQQAFTYSIGGGIRVELSKQVNLTFRYLYTDLGRAKTSKDGNIPALAPISTSLSTQAWVGGFTYIFN